MNQAHNSLKHKDTTNPNCNLCDKLDTLEHVLSSCSTALTQDTDGDTTQPLESWLERKKEHGNNPQHGHIAFVKSDDTSTTQPTLQNRSVGKTQTAQPTLQNRSVGKTQTAQPALQNRSVGKTQTAQPTLQHDLHCRILGGTTGWNMEVYLGKKLIFLHT